MKMNGYRPNIILVTLDSCRSDVFFSSSLTHLNKYVKFRAGFAHGTYTLPSHQSMFQGIFPSTRTNEWYFNRFSKQLIRLQPKSRKKQACYIELESKVGNVIQGLNLQNYLTLCIGAVGWFKTPQLVQYFEKSIFTGIDFGCQIEEFEQSIKSEKRPSFCLINVGGLTESGRILFMFLRTNSGTMFLLIAGMLRQ